MGSSGTGSCGQSPPQLYRPPTIKPPQSLLSPLKFIVATLRNPITGWSRLVYEKPIVAGSLFNRPFVFVCDPVVIRRILVTEEDAFPKGDANRRIFSPAVGDSLLTAEGDSWRWQRRTVAPVFRTTELAAYLPAMIHAAEATLDKWRRDAASRVRRADDAMMEIAFAAIAETMVSGDEVLEASVLRHSMSEYLGPTPWLMLYDLLGIPEWVPYPRRARLHRAASVMRTGVASILANRRHRSRGTSDNDLLDRLMAAKDPETGKTMSDTNVVDNVLTILLAGHETTAVALSWTLALLAQAPAWQDRVKEEVRTVIGGNPIEFAHLDRLTLTDQVIKESLRLFPPAALLVRVAAQETDLGGHSVAPGTRIIIPIYAIHRHSMLWEDPEAFDPSRFSPEGEATRSRYAYLPFGAGPRICAGMTFALQEMKAVLAALIRRVRIGPGNRPPPLPLLRVTLRPQGGMRLRVTFESG